MNKIILTPNHVSNLIKGTRNVLIALPILLLFASASVGLTGCSDKAKQQTGGEVPDKDHVPIEPGLGVGKIHAHMTAEQVIAELGAPDNKTGHVLNYTHLGFSVIPTKDDVVRVIMCGDSSSFDSPLVRAFKGRTKEGVGMGSSRSDVIKEFGPPNATERQASGQEALKYPQIGMTFTLDADKVCHIVVDLKNAR